MVSLLPDSGSELKPRPVLDATADRNKVKNLLSRAYTNVADDDGWALISRIAVYLRAHGKTLDESGCTSLTDALRASGLFAMRDLGGMNKDFRLGNSRC